MLRSHINQRGKDLPLNKKKWTKYTNYNLQKKTYDYPIRCPNLNLTNKISTLNKDKATIFFKTHMPNFSVI